MGKSIYFSDEQLLELEQALIGHADGAQADFMPIIDAASFKVALALERPWAIKKVAETTACKGP